MSGDSTVAMFAEPIAIRAAQGYRRRRKIAVVRPIKNGSIEANPA